MWYLIKGLGFTLKVVGWLLLNLVCILLYLVFMFKLPKGFWAFVWYSEEEQVEEGVPYNEIRHKVIWQYRTPIGQLLGSKDYSNSGYIYTSDNLLDDYS